MDTMVWVSILVPIITSILTLIGVVYTSSKSHDKTTMEVQKQIELLEQKYEITMDEIKKDIKILDEGVHKYNNLKDRMFEAEKLVALLEKDQEVANHRIKDLEKRPEYVKPSSLE